MAEEAAEIPPGIVLSALQILVSPNEAVPKSADTPSGSQNYFQLLLQQNLEDLRQKLTSDPRFHPVQSFLSSTIDNGATDSDPQWHFVLHCLQLLALLQESLTSALEKFQRKTVEGGGGTRKPSQAPPLSPDTLSLQQQKTVSAALQFVVCLGVVPCLQAGVGLPLSARSQFASTLAEAGSASDEVKLSRLLTCGRVLVSCLGVESLCGLVLSHHVNDVLALLLQLCHGTKWEKVKPQDAGVSVPESQGGCSEKQGVVLKAEGSETCIPEIDSTRAGTETGLEMQSCRTAGNETKPSSDSSVTGTPSPSNVPQEPTDSDSLRHPDSTQASSNQSQAHKQLCFDWLRKVLEQVPPQRLVQELLVLQGRPQKRAPTGGGKPPLAGVSGTPPWLRRVCGRLLRDILVAPQGVFHILSGMLLGPSGEFSGNWQSCDAVAKVIAMGARTSTSREDYYRLVCPQVLSLLHQPSKTAAGCFLRVVSASLREMLAQDGALAQRHLVEPLLAPFLRCLSVDGFVADAALLPGQLLLSETEMTSCVENLHRVLVLGAEPDSTLPTCLEPVIPILYQTYSVARAGISHLRSPCRELLGAYLRKVETTLAVACLQSLALHQDSVGRFRPVPSGLLLQPGPLGGVVVTVATADRAQGESNVTFLTEEDCQGVTELLADLQACGLAGEFFIFLMKELTNVIKAETDSEAGDGCSPSATGSQISDHQQTLLSIERRQEEVAASFQCRLSMLSLLAAMCEALGPACLKSTMHILEFAEATLQRGQEVCEKSGEELTELFQSETLTMAMGLLTAVMAEGKKLAEPERCKMDELLPLLERIGSNHSDPSVQEMACDLRIAIATRGVVWSSLMREKVARAEATQSEKMSRVKKTKVSTSSDPPRKSKPLIEVISETVSDTSDEQGSSAQPQNPVPEKSLENLKIHKEEHPTDPTPLGKNVSSRTSPSVEPRTSSLREFPLPLSGKVDERSALEQAYEELCDPLVPVRGHALLSLARLVDEGNAQALADMDTLLKVFLENIAHGDSYLYLASVNGLAALAAWRHQTVVPVLTREFADWHSAGETPKSPELRAKLGEVLVKTTRNLGDLAPKYRDVLLAAMLSGTRDMDSMVRASSLSSLGELCRLLRYALGSVLHEVLECCGSLLKTDGDAEVRKAAGLVLTQLLTGLGKDVFKVLEPVLKDLYHLLRLRVAVETDEGVRLHLLLALEQLDAVTRDFLFPKQSLEKKIRVLSAD